MKMNRPRPTETPKQEGNLKQTIAKMIQEDGEHLYQKRTGIDRKQRQKIIEKKMAQGKRHQAEYENYQGIDMQ